MALLQVRNFPDDIYALLSLLAEKENRSIAQQTVHILQNEFSDSDFQNILKRRKALDSLKSVQLKKKFDSEKMIEIIRKDRDGNFSPDFENNEGRLR